MCAAGAGADEIYRSLQEGKTGLGRCDFEYAKDLETFIGRVKGIENSPVDGELRVYDCRNNRLAQLGLKQDGFDDHVANAREKYGAKRIAVLIGTSSSGILETEIAYRNKSKTDGSLPENFKYKEVHSIYSIVDFTRRYLKLEGLAVSVATACSSSAKVFPMAYRYIKAGLCDAAVVGGVDSLCQTTLYGFSSLELVSKSKCRPCDADRDGISLGEAAGFALLEKNDISRYTDDSLLFCGYGESGDAYHMSSPHPDGDGAKIAMTGAMNSAGLKPDDIDYINMHGTASQPNDKVEDMAINAVLGPKCPASSTKGWTGHTLGAAGALEAVISAICIKRGLTPGCLNTVNLDSRLLCNVILETGHRKVNRVLSNSFWCTHI